MAKQKVTNLLVALLASVKIESMIRKSRSAAFNEQHDRCKLADAWYESASRQFASQLKNFTFSPTAQPTESESKSSWTATLFFNRTWSKRCPWRLGRHCSSRNGRNLLNEFNFFFGQISFRSEFFYEIPNFFFDRFFLTEFIFRPNLFFGRISSRFLPILGVLGYFRPQFTADILFFAFFGQILRGFLLSFRRLCR